MQRLASRILRQAGSSRAALIRNRWAQREMRKTMNTDCMATMLDGRRLGYADCGNSQGKPLMIFGGWPSSRLMALLYHKRMESIGIRLIGVDRPGVGLSDPQPNRHLLDWAKDVSALMDELGLEKTGVIGNSSGAPYALVCAYGIPSCLTGCGLVSGLSPQALPGGNMGGYMGLLTLLARKAAWLQAAVIWWTLGRHCRTETGAKAVAEWIVRNGTEVDRQAVEKHGHLPEFTRQLHETFRQGVKGAAMDWRVITGDWGFEPKQIKYERMFLWHGALDSSIPIDSARELERQLPQCVAKYYQEEGHGSTLDNHIEEIATIVTEESPSHTRD